MVILNTYCLPIPRRFFLQSAVPSVLQLVGEPNRPLHSHPFNTSCIGNTDPIPTPLSWPTTLVIVPHLSGPGLRPSIRETSHLFIRLGFHLTAASAVALLSRLALLARAGSYIVVATSRLHRARLQLSG